MTCHYLELFSASDWLCRERNLLQPIESTTQILVVMRHQYGIYTVIAQISFRGKPVVAWRNIGCFPRLGGIQNGIRKTELNIQFGISLLFRTMN